MPHSPSAKKRFRQSETRRQRNRVHRSLLRTVIKSVREAESAADAEAAYRNAERMLDRAARKRLIHPTAAARKKSRLRKVVQSK